MQEHKEVGPKKQAIRKRIPSVIEQVRIGVSAGLHAPDSSLT